MVSMEGKGEEEEEIKTNSRLRPIARDFFLAV